MHQTCFVLNWHSHDLKSVRRENFVSFLASQFLHPLHYFVNLEDIFRNLDWWLRLRLSHVWETSTSITFSTALENAFIDSLEPVTFSNELEDTFKWTLSKLLSELSAPKEPSFLDIMLKSTLLTGDLDVSSKNHYIYYKNYLPW